MTGQEGTTPYSLVLEGPHALKLLAHEARQLVIAEIYDGRELTATEAAQLCGLTPSAMSYHLRMLERAGVLIADADATDGRERRYRRAAQSFEVRGGGTAGKVQLKATVSIWIDGLTRAVERWVGASTRGSGGLHTETLRLTDAENAEMVERVRAVFREYAELSDGRGEGFARWETYWAHVPRSDERTA